MTTVSAPTLASVLFEMFTIISWNCSDFIVSLLMTKLNLKHASISPTSNVTDVLKLPESNLPRRQVNSKLIGWYTYIEILAVGSEPNSLKCV